MIERNQLVSFTNLNHPNHFMQTHLFIVVTSHWNTTTIGILAFLCVSGCGCVVCPVAPPRWGVAGDTLPTQPLPHFLPVCSCQNVYSALQHCTVTSHPCISVSPYPLPMWNPSGVTASGPRKPCTTRLNCSSFSTRLPKENLSRLQVS